MAIEISDKRYWKKMGYYDGLMYCSLLNIDGKDNWRMIRRDEFEEEPNINYHKELIYDGFWFIADGEIYGDGFIFDLDYWVIPVRDY